MSRYYCQLFSTLKLGACPPQHPHLDLVTCLNIFFYSILVTAKSRNMTEVTQHRASVESLVTGGVKQDPWNNGGREIGLAALARRHEVRKQPVIKQLLRAIIMIRHKIDTLDVPNLYSVDDRGLILASRSIFGRMFTTHVPSSNLLLYLFCCSPDCTYKW